jgi:hypothetical protein
MFLLQLSFLLLSTTLLVMIMVHELLGNVMTKGEK